MQSVVAMQHGNWSPPEFREINLGAEIGMYIEEPDEPDIDESSLLDRRAPEPCA